MKKTELQAYFFYYKKTFISLVGAFLIVFIFIFLYFERYIGDRSSAYGLVENRYAKSTITGNKEYLVISYNGYPLTGILVSDNVEVGSCIKMTINQTLLGRTIVDSYMPADMKNCKIEE